MSWKIDIAYRDRGDSLADALLLAGRVAPEERQTTFQLLLDEVVNGDSANVGELLDRLEHETADERRGRLNRARTAAKLPTVEAVEARREMEARSRGLAARGVPERDEAGRTLAFCANKNCQNFPVNQAGVHALTKAKHWWCETHRHLAEDGDMADWSPRIRFAPGGGIEWAADVEREREQALREEQRTRTRNEHRRQERAPEAEEYRRHEAAMAEFYRSRGAGWDPLP